MNEDKTLISIIVPIFGVEKYISKFAHSLLSQSMTDNIEYIFIDDCTQDSSIRILKSVISEYPTLKDRCYIFHHRTNRGLAASRNTGMSYAKGTYVLHIDSDDWLSPYMLETMAQTIIKDETIDVVICDYYGAYSKKNIEYHQNIPHESKDLFKKMLKGEILYAPWNKLIKRSLFNKYKIEWTEGLNMWEDVSVIPKIIYYSKRIAYIPQALYYYNQQNVNSYSKNWNTNSVLNVCQAYKIINMFVNDLNDNDDYKKELEEFAIKTEFAILSHSPFSKTKYILSAFPKITIMQIFDSSLPIYEKVGFILYKHSLHKMGNLLLKCVNGIKKIVR